MDLSLLALLLPIVLLVSAVVGCWIRLVSPGPVLFRQTRIGKGGQPFTIYKFRTMHRNAATRGHEEHVQRLMQTDQPLTKLDRLGDDRLIRGAGVIRTLGLDELPQLWNLLRGEMSLVGPRPCLPAEYESYQPTQLGRFAVEPGLTGAWQVARSDATTFRQMLAMDESYVARRSPWTDLSIVVRTPIVLVTQFLARFPAKVPGYDSRSPRGAEHRS